MKIEIHPLDASRREDFYRLHSERNGHAWCNCVAWWVDSFDGWGERTAESNRALREQVFDRGDYDGYLLYADGDPVVWCQCCERDKLEHLCRRKNLDPDPNAWVIACFFVAPSHRGLGLARAMLKGVIADLRLKGVKKIEVFPRRGADLPMGELWSGPEKMVREAGFTLVRDDESLPHYVLTP